MTTLLQATEAVYERVRTGWTTTAFELLGEHFVRPAAAPWIRVMVATLAPAPMSHGPTGGRYIQRRARIVAQCFAPHAITGGDDGMGAAIALAETFQALFEGTDLATASAGSLVFTEGEVRTVGIDGKWAQVNVSVSFTYDATL